MAAFFVLASTLSWLAWLPAILFGGGQALLVPGAFGPAVAAYLVIWSTGGSVRAWARQILHWRVQSRWYLYALGLPALLFEAVNGTLAVLGKPVDLVLLADRAPSYLASFAFVALLGGSFMAALDDLTLTADNLTVDLTILAVLVAATLVLVAVTRGRVGLQPTVERSST